MEFVKEEPGVAPEPHSVSAENESQVLVSSTEEGEDDGVSFCTPVWQNCQYFRYFYLSLTNVSLYFLYIPVESVRGVPRWLRVRRQRDPVLREVQCGCPSELLWCRRGAGRLMVLQRVCQGRW